jgi:phosphatidylserine/phosphatidylglycerophosphate/cardiolipin synthase-like enzyme
MKFHSSSEVGDALFEALSHAKRARISSAFFCPGKDTLALLNGVKDLTLVISEEFTINDPLSLERLKTAVKRSVPPGSDDGKLHAKVFIADMPDGSKWVLLGSANLTEQGLFSNQEACVSLASANLEDRSVISEIEIWFANVLKRSRAIDMSEAKRIWNARSKQKLEPVKKKKTAPAYWVIKTTEGGGDWSAEHWPTFESENVVAIGWQAIRGDPSSMSDMQLLAAVKHAYPNKPPKSDAFSVKIIREFVNMPVGTV